MEKTKFSIFIVKNDGTRQIFTKPNDKLALTSLASEYLRNNDDVKHVIIDIKEYDHDLLIKETKEYYYAW